MDDRVCGGVLMWDSGHDPGATAFPASEILPFEAACRLFVEGNGEIGIFFCDVNGTITSWNPGVETIFGYTQTELVGQPIHILFTPEDREARAPEREMASAVSTGLSLDIRWHLRKDGSRVFVDGVLTAIRRDGAVTGFAKVVRNATERNREQEALRASQRLLESILGSIGDGFFALDSEYRYMYVNEAAERLTGVSRAERLGRRVWDVFPDMSGGDWLAQLRTTMEQRVPVRFTQRQRGRWFEVRAYPTAEDGITVSFSDITEAKRSEEERQRLREALDLTPAFTRNLDGTIEWWSSGCENLFQWSKSEAVGKLSRQLLQTQGPVPLDGLDALLLERGAWRGELLHVRRDGRPIHVESVWRLLRGENSRNTVVEVSIDVTERKEAEARADELNRALRNSNQELEHFTYALSHDLQAPLRNMTSYTELLARRIEPELDPSGQEYLRFIRQSLVNMRALIDAVLSYSHAAHSGPRPVQPASLNDVLSAVLATLQPVIEETGAHITLDELPSLMADPIELHQLFSNLVGNALKYTNSKTPEVNISARRDQDFWTVSVRDNGIGIDPRFTESIFGVFKRLHGADYPGTGIGLAICKKIVERNGGKIWAESQPGQGSTFFFTWPV